MFYNFEVDLDYYVSLVRKNTSSFMCLRSRKSLTSYISAPQFCCSKKSMPQNISRSTSTQRVFERVAARRITHFSAMTYITLRDISRESREAIDQSERLN